MAKPATPTPDRPDLARDSKDITTRRLIEDILAVEEEHAHELLTLLQAQ